MRFDDKFDKKIIEDIDYPNLKDLEVMLITPNDYYRKKFFGLGKAYVATAMKMCGIKIHVMSCDIWSYDDIEIAKILVESKVKVFCIGAMYPMFREVERLCRIIRALVCNSTIILGGALPSPIPEFVLRRTGADIAVLGEAELTIPKLMSALAGERNLEGVEGIAYMVEGKFYSNGKPQIFKYISKKEVGWPAFDLFPVEKYITAPKFYPFESNDRVLPISTGRGCPYSCNFCYRPTAFRLRPVDDILDEMVYLIDRYKLNGFYIADDLTMINKKRISEICDGIVSRGLKIKFNIYGRVNVVTPEILRMLKEAGCIAIFYGLESGNQKILDNMSKKTTISQIYDAIRITRESGIYCDYAFMFGQPGDNKETLRDTINLIKVISYGEFRSFKIFGCVPFPGSELYDWCKQTGHLKDDEDFYNRYINQDMALDQIPVNMTDLPHTEINKLFKEADEELKIFFINNASAEWINFFSKKKDN